MQQFKATYNAVDTLYDYTRQHGMWRWFHAETSTLALDIREITRYHIKQ